MVGQKRTLNSGRPSEKQALQECHIFTNLALAKEYWRDQLTPLGTYLNR